MYLSKIYAMFKHDFEKIGSAVSKHSENIKAFGFSAKNLAENPKKLAGFEPQEPQLFGCMSGSCYSDSHGIDQLDRTIVSLFVVAAKFVSDLLQTTH